MEFQVGSFIFKKKRTSIVVELENWHKDAHHPNHKFRYAFKDKEDFNSFADAFKKLMLNVWPLAVPESANSIASDYNEYYDRELDNNGYCYVRLDEMCFEGPYIPDSPRLFVFNKRKAQSFLHGLESLQGV